MYVCIQQIETKMVEVLKSNFNDLMPEIKENINMASFIAVDTEFTGLTASSDTEPSLFDTLENLYNKRKNMASNFVISQFGLTTFTRCENNRYCAKTYTFYLCPHQCGSNDRRFMVQASCAHFLAQHNFDFNKFVYEGIPYLNEVEEKQAKLEISKNRFADHHFRNLNKRGTDPKLVEFSEHGKVGEDVTLEKDLIGHEYFQLKYLRLMYPETWSIIENNQVLVQKVSKEQRNELEATEREEEEIVLEFYIGFSHIFKTLVQAKKPLIGHNMLTDIFLIYNSFYKPLPQSYKEFKKEFTTMFPVVYDTKHIWCNMKKFYNIRNIPTKSELHYLYELLQRPPDDLVTLFSPIIDHINGDNYCQHDQQHNAGFDSYVTGFVFLKLCHIFAMKNTKSLVQVVPQTLKQHLKAVDPFVNRINVSLAKLHYINFAGVDSYCHRPELLFVKFKNDNQPFDLEKIRRKISYYGFIEIKQVSSNEAIVAIASFGGERNILNELQDDDEILLMPYNYFQHHLLPRCKFWSTCLGVSCIGSYILYRILRSI